jgi:hypothetical protein
VIQAVATNPPTVGATTATGMQLVWMGSPLIDGAAGDRVFLAQLSPETAAGVAYLNLARALEVPATFAMTDGTDNRIAGALVEVPRVETVALDWRRSQFEAQCAAIHPDASVLTEELGVAAVPGGDECGARRPWNHLIHVPPIGATTDADLGDVAYGNPYPAAWGVFGFAHATCVILYELSGASRTAQAATLSVMDQVAAFGAGPIVPALTPVTDLRVNGADATDGLTGAGIHPTISWSAPVTGTPTHFVVAVFEVYVNYGMTSVGLVAALQTTASEAVIPPGMMESGRHYTFLVRAVSEPATDAEAAPFRASLPFASADAYTGIVDP